MSVTLYEYPKCGTCRNAKKWLDAQSVSYEAIHIVENPPSAEELKELHQKKWFRAQGIF